MCGLALLLLLFSGASGCALFASTTESTAEQPRAGFSSLEAALHRISVASPGEMPELMASIDATMRRLDGRSRSTLREARAYLVLDALLLDPQSSARVVPGGASAGAWVVSELAAANVSGERRALVEGLIENAGAPERWLVEAHADLLSAPDLLLRAQALVLRAGAERLALPASAGIEWMGSCPGGLLVAAGELSGGRGAALCERDDLGAELAALARAAAPGGASVWRSAEALWYVSLDQLLRQQDSAADAGARLSRWLSAERAETAAALARVRMRQSLAAALPRGDQTLKLPRSRATTSLAGRPLPAGSAAGGAPDAGTRGADGTLAGAEVLEASPVTADTTQAGARAAHTSDAGMPGMATTAAASAPDIQIATSFDPVAAARAPLLLMFVRSTGVDLALRPLILLDREAEARWERMRRVQPDAGFALPGDRVLPFAGMRAPLEGEPVAEALDAFPTALASLESTLFAELDGAPLSDEALQIALLIDAETSMAVLGELVTRLGEDVGSRLLPLIRAPSGDGLRALPLRMMPRSSAAPEGPYLRLVLDGAGATLHSGGTPSNPAADEAAPASAPEALPWSTHDLPDVVAGRTASRWAELAPRQVPTVELVADDILVDWGLVVRFAEALATALGPEAALSLRVAILPAR